MTNKYECGFDAVFKVTGACGIGRPVTFYDHIRIVRPVDDAKGWHLVCIDFYSCKKATPIPLDELRPVVLDRWLVRLTANTAIQINGLEGHWDQIHTDKHKMEIIDCMIKLSKAHKLAAGLQQRDVDEQART